MRYAQHFVHDLETARDVVQDTFLRLFERLDQFEGRSRLSTWLYRVATNLAIDQLHEFYDDFQEEFQEFIVDIKSQFEV